MQTTAECKRQDAKLRGREFVTLSETTPRIWHIVVGQLGGNVPKPPASPMPNARPSCPVSPGPTQIQLQSIMVSTQSGKFQPPQSPDAVSRNDGTGTRSPGPLGQWSICRRYAPRATLSEELGKIGQHRLVSTRSRFAAWPLVVKAIRAFAQLDSTCHSSWRALSTRRPTSEGFTCTV